MVRREPRGSGRDRTVVVRGRVGDGPVRQRRRHADGGLVDVDDGVVGDPNLDRHAVGQQDRDVDATDAAGRGEHIEAGESGCESHCDGGLFFSGGEGVMD